MRQSLTWLAAGLVLSIAVVGCDDDGGVDVDAGPGGADSGPGGTDGGPLADAGPAPDGGPVGDAGTDAGTDSGPEPDPTCEMGRVRVQETCPEFIPCGGDPIGEWCYSEVCVTTEEVFGPALEQARAEFPDFVPAECTAESFEVRESDGEIEGEIVITDTTARRHVVTMVTATFYMSSDCNIGSCSLVGGLIDGALGAAGDASCVNAEAGGCLCDVSFSSSATDPEQGYTLEDTAIDLNSGSRFEYCIEEDGRFRFRDDGIEPGVQGALPLSDD